MLYCFPLHLLLLTLPNVYFFFSPYSLSLCVYLNWFPFDCQETKIEIQLPPRLLSSISLTSLVKPLRPLFVCTGATAACVQQYSGAWLQPRYTYGVLFLSGSVTDQWMAQDDKLASPSRGLIISSHNACTLVLCHPIL